MRITKRQLRRLIREALEEAVVNKSAAEAYDELWRNADAALSGWMRTLEGQPHPDEDPELWEDLGQIWDAMVDNPDPQDVSSIKALANELNLRPSTITFHARKIRPNTAYPTAAELQQIIGDRAKEQEALKKADTKARSEIEKKIDKIPRAELLKKYKDLIATHYDKEVVEDRSDRSGNVVVRSILRRKDRNAVPRKDFLIMQRAGRLMGGHPLEGAYNFELSNGSQAVVMTYSRRSPN